MGRESIQADKGHHVDEYNDNEFDRYYGHCKDLMSTELNRSANYSVTIIVAKLEGRESGLVNGFQSLGTSPEYQCGYDGSLLRI